MSRERFLTIVVISLLVVNCAIVLYLFIGHQRPPRPELFKVIATELNFDEAQRKKFFGLRDAHRDSMNRLDERFNSIVESYLGLLEQENYSPAFRDSLDRADARG